jgi:hypothetical protein
MIFHRAVKIDWASTHKERNRLNGLSNNKENKSRITKQYSPGDQVLLALDPDERHSQPKLDAPTRGPFTIKQVNNKGAVEIDRGNLNETINILRIKPFHSG